MFQTSEDVIKWVHDRKKFGIKPGLERMEWMMEKLDHPERRSKGCTYWWNEWKRFDHCLSTFNFTRRRF